MCTLETDVPLSRIQPVCVKGSCCLLPCMQCVITGIAVPVCISEHSQPYLKKGSLGHPPLRKPFAEASSVPQELSMFWVRWRQPPSLCRSCVSVWMLLFLRFPGFCKTLLTSMRVGHTGRDTAHVSKRAHCQLSLAILHARCCCFRYNGTLVAPPLCKLANSGEGAKLRASAAAAQQLSHLKATSSN